MNKDEAALDPMEVLRREYLASLEDKMRGIDEAWRALCGNGHVEQHLRTLLRLAHNLAGSSGLYGLREITDCARRLERELGQVTPGAAPPATLVPQIDALLERLASETRAVQSGPARPGAAPGVPLS